MDNRYSVWIFADNQTGIFSNRSYNGPDNFLELNTPENTIAYESGSKAAVDTLSKKLDINTMELVDYQPPSPADDQWQTWSWDTVIKRWKPNKTLAFYKKEKLNEIIITAKAKDIEDITIQSSTFKADEETKAELLSEALIAQMAILDSQSYSLDWEKSDGTNITLNANQLKALIRAIRQRSNSLKATYRTLKTQVQTATTKEELDLIVWH
jgi:hypothetical protein